MTKSICFFPDEKEGIFPHMKNFFDKYLNSKKKILIIGPHIKPNNLTLINSNEYDLKILTIYEPIKNMSKENEKYHICNEIVKNYNKYNLYLFGCVENKPKEKKIKFPLYMLERFPIYDAYNNFFLKINKYIKNTNIFSKKFCCLINRWDPDNHRTKMYNTIRKINTIHCPSNLLNNCSNNLLNKIGKSNYIKIFLFNICSENFDNDTFEGYITEKLMDACLGGAIPIYAGWFDEYDAKIFNKNRILFYNSKNIESYEKVYKKVKELIDDKNKLIEFYRQPVFCDTAFETIQKLKNDFVRFVNE